MARGILSEIEVEVYVATSTRLCHIERRRFYSILDFGSICYGTPSLLLAEGRLKVGYREKSSRSLSGLVS